jgi:hypothetical protein
VSAGYESETTLGGDGEPPSVAALELDPAWITPEMVCAYLDIPGTADARMIDCTAAVRVAVERRRDDLDFALGAPDDIRVGSIRWAGLMYQARGAPSGFSGYDDQSTLYDALGAQRAEILRLIGWRRPLAR